MTIQFKTNLDWYRGLSWPVLSEPPHKGELVHVFPASEGFCEAHNIPKILEVVEIVYYFDRVVCELWYRKMDTEYADSSRFSHLMKQ